MTWTRPAGRRAPSMLAVSSVSAAEEYFYGAVDAYCNAVAASGEVERKFRIGRELVRVRFAGRALVSTMTAALDHLDESASTKPATFTICVFDTLTTGASMPRPAWPGECYGARGEIAGFNCDRFRTVYQPGVDVFQMIDKEARTAVYWVQEPSVVPYWEQSFPFRTTFHWMLQGKPYQLMHAGAVGREGGGVLITGPSGSGKSTTCLACLKAGMLYAGDDYVLAGTEPPFVHSLYATAKLVPENLHRFPNLESSVTNLDRLSKEKALIFVKSVRPSCLTPGFPIRAILTPRVTGERDTRLVRSTGIAGLKALAPTTVLHLPGGGSESLAKMSRLVKQVPNYVLEAGTDLPQIPRVIDELLAGRTAGETACPTALPTASGGGEL